MDFDYQFNANILNLIFKDIISKIEEEKQMKFDDFIDSINSNTLISFDYSQLKNCNIEIYNKDLQQVFLVFKHYILTFTYNKKNIKSVNISSKATSSTIDFEHENVINDSVISNQNETITILKEFVNVINVQRNIEKF